MAQNRPTTCAHNAEGQVLVIGKPVSCRKCGAPIEPEAQAVNPTGNISREAIAAGYPGEVNA
jgi:hypothetical protein